MDTERDDSEISELTENIKALNQSISRFNSLGRAIFISLLKGAATALGATIVAAAVLAGLARSVRTLSDVPILGPLIESTQVEHYITDEEPGF